jgi:glycosyltransferase involved in cell wall biosynthesis
MKINNISIGLPCYNEENNIKVVINNCLKFIKKNKIKNWELLLVDNKSTDSTTRIIHSLINKYKSSNIKLIKNKKNILYSGSANKIIQKSKFNLVCIMDSDNQYDINDISKLYNFLNQKKLDLVIGKRVNRQDPTSRKIISKIFLFFSRILINNNLKDLNCGLRILKKNKIIKKYIKYNLNFCNPELYARYLSNNLKIGETKINHFDRDNGKSIHNLINLSKTFFIVIIYLFKLRNI